MSSDSSRSVQSLAIAVVCTMLLSACATDIAPRPLVTAAEIAAETEVSNSKARETALEDFIKRSDPLGPKIVVREPDLSGPVLPPVDIDVQFQPTGGSSVDIESFRAYYGFLKLDVTDRILENAAPSADGIRCSEVVLPPGKHTLTVEIADDKGRKSREKFKFRVSKP
ncbi:MAG: hypothetical protein AAGC71_11620 [Pseudomonadota bacterium]